MINRKVQARLQSGQKVFDERLVAIKMQADRATYWILFVYLLFRGIATLGASPENTANYFRLLVTNPWLQTVGFLLLINFLTHAYFNRKMS